MNIISVIGGLAGAGTLKALDGTIRKLDKNDRVDLLGMNAVARFLKGSRSKPPAFVDRIMPLPLASDLISNSLFFGMAQGSTSRQTYVRGALLGLGAGIGAITVGKNLDSTQHVVPGSPGSKALTVAGYIAGGLVAAAIINLFSKK